MQESKTSTLGLQLVLYHSLSVGNPMFFQCKYIIATLGAMSMETGCVVFVVELRLHISIYVSAVGKITW